MKTLKNKILEGLKVNSKSKIKGDNLEPMLNSIKEFYKKYGKEFNGTFTIGSGSFLINNEQKIFNPLKNIMNLGSVEYVKFKKEIQPYIDEINDEHYDEHYKVTFTRNVDSGSLTIYVDYYTKNKGTNIGYIDLSNSNKDKISCSFIVVSDIGEKMIINLLINIINKCLNE